MKYLYMLPLFVLIRCNHVQGVLEWTVIGKVTNYGQNVTLFCNVTNCCPEYSGWDRWTPVQRTLFIDVKTGRPNRKYDGYVLRNGYTLVIQNLTKEDLNVSYSCLYGVTFGERKFLLEDDVFRYITTTEPNNPTGNSSFSSAGIMSGVLFPMVVACVFIGFIFRSQRKKRNKSNGNSTLDDKWKSGDDPVVMHRLLSPSCALLTEPRLSSSSNQEGRTIVVSNNTDSTIDTRTVTGQGLNQSENASSTSEPILQISSSYNGTSNNVQERQGNQQSSIYNRDRSNSATGNENSQETQTSKENQNATGTSSCQHNTEFESPGIHLEKPKYPNYVRISSFEGWPSYLDQSPHQIAMAGFLFAGYHDYTRCLFYCSTVDTRTVTIQGLNQSENASTSEPSLELNPNGASNNLQERQENQLYSATNRDKTSSATGNESSQETQTPNENHNATGTSSCQHNTEFESLGIHLEKPKYPNYACLTVRISSFKGWPSYLDQSPRQMALAGFLFAGYHDYTRCFFCGGGLRNWEAGDDPWVEHARLFPKCTFLKQNKGEKFINAVQNRQEEIDRETNATNTQETTPRAQTSSLAVNNSTTSTTHRDVLQTVAARSVLELGYTQEQVENAFFRYLTTSGKDIQCVSAMDVMSILLDNEGHLEQQGVTVDVTQHASDTKNAGGHRSGSTNTECNGIDNTGNEQNVLFDDTENLIEINRQLRDRKLCKLCLDLEASIAFLPCGHIVCCIDCAPVMRKCPVCRTYVKGTVKTYLA